MTTTAERLLELVATEIRSAFFAGHGRAHNSYSERPADEYAAAYVKQRLAALPLLEKAAGERQRALNDVADYLIRCGEYGFESLAATIRADDFGITPREGEKL
jgi:hypothetical protein